MKKVFLLFLLVSVTFVAKAQIKVSTNGNVGIGTASPSYRLDVLLSTDQTFRIQTWTDVYINNTGLYGGVCLYPNDDFYLQLGRSGQRVGQIWACEIHGIWTLEYSDIRLKENIRPIENPLQKIQQLNGIRYTMKAENFEGLPEEKKAEYMQDEYGFVAQELQEVLPEVVVADSNGTLSVKYTRIIPVLVEALKAQQKEIDSLRQKSIEERSALVERINELQSILSQQQSMTSTTFTGLETDAPVSVMHVFQNMPNPFTETTAIRCFIPSDKHNVQLCIYDMRGIQQKCIPVSERGYVTVSVGARELNAGIYLYLLQADGQVSEAKQMIITQ